MDRMHSSAEIEEPINANGKRRKRSDVWTHFEEVEISSKTSDGILQKVVKIKCKGCNQYFTRSESGTTSSLKRHIEVHCRQQWGNRRRSDVWTHFEEVEISSKNSDGILQKVVKIKCKGCNRYFTKSKSGTTSTLKRHIEARHPHLQQASSRNEDTVRAEASEADKTAKMGGTSRRSDVGTQFEEVAVTEKKQKGLNFKVSSQNEDTVRAEVSETDKTAKMGGTSRRSDLGTQFEEVAVTEKKQKGLNFKVSSQNEDTVRAEVSETGKIAKMGGTRRRSDVWTQFEEVMVTEKKQKGSNFKVKKLKCKKCKKLFTMSKDGCTTTLKRHMEETCAIRNGQKSLLDYCIKS